MSQFEELGKRAAEVGRLDAVVETGIDRERLEKERFLGELVRHALPALEALSGAPPKLKEPGLPVVHHATRRGVMVAAMVSAESVCNWLFIDPAGAFFGARVRGVPSFERRIDGKGWDSFEANYADLTVADVVDGRWPVNEIAEGLARALESQRKGLEKASSKVERVTKVVRAAADLLSEVK